VVACRKHLTLVDCEAVAGMVVVPCAAEDMDRHSLAAANDSTQPVVVPGGRRMNVSEVALVVSV